MTIVEFQPFLLFYPVELRYIIEGENTRLTDLIQMHINSTTHVHRLEYDIYDKE